jgi:hypothetical protein
MFEKNVGETDKVVRALVATVLIGLSHLLELELTLKLLLAALGVILFFTATFSICLLYSIIGINTSKK